MKNNIISAALLALAVVLLASCSKDNDTRSSIPPADLKVYNQVKQFREQLKSGLKNGPVMGTDSAQWYIETTLNLTYGSAAFPFEGMNLDTFYVQMPVNAGSVSFADVQQAYETLLGNITAQYYALTAENKQFVFCHLRPVENNLKNDSETWEMVSGVGEGPINLFNFGVNDHWIWWNQNPNQSGICDGPAYPGGYGSDAAEEIQKKVHLRKGVPQGNYYFSDFTFVEVYPWEYDFVNHNDPTPGDNIMDYHLFYTYNDPSLPNAYHFCLSPVEMNFYLNGMERIIYSTYPYGRKPADKNFVSVDVQGDLISNPTPPYISLYLHWANIKYGILHLSQDPPQDL